MNGRTLTNIATADLASVGPTFSGAITIERKVIFPKKSPFDLNKSPEQKRFDEVFRKGNFKTAMAGSIQRHLDDLVMHALTGRALKDVEQVEPKLLTLEVPNG